MKRLSGAMPYYAALSTLCLGILVGGYAAGPLLHGQPAATPPSPVFPKELTSYREVVKRVLPAVVSLEARAKPRPVKGQSARPPRLDNMPNDPEGLRRFLEELQQSPGQFGGQEQRPGFGSGFLVDPKGIVLTNFHVVDGADQVIVQLASGEKFSSRDIHGDSKTDLAIVRFNTNGKQLPFLELGDSEAMEIGDRVLAVGAPFGLTGSVTAGIISAKGRYNLNMNMYEDFLQTDAAINPGNSGGPLINLEGRVIGINSAIKTRTGGFQGVGLAVASNLAKNIMKSLSADGVVHRGYLGIQIRELSSDVARRLGVGETGGVLVGQVFENTPAARAGLQPGDVITSIGGKATKDGRLLQTVVAGLPLKKSAEVQFVRDGQTKTVPVTIEEQPKDYGNARVPALPQVQQNLEAVALDKIGAKVAELTPDMATELGYAKSSRGVVITEVERGSVASQNGLRPGMLITKVDRKAVNDTTAARRALESGSLTDGVLLQVQTPSGGTNYVLLRKES
jgi:serine protease Do